MRGLRPNITPNSGDKPEFDLKLEPQIFNRRKRLIWIVELQKATANEQEAGFSLLLEKNL
jgi:hypothetical protein